jgi:hypothetical protein
MDRSLAVTQETRRYFQRGMIKSGDDILHSSFGRDLSMLGLDGRQLQAIPSDQAYALTRAAVGRVADIRVRRRMLLELFNDTED